MLACGSHRWCSAQGIGSSSARRANPLSSSCWEARKRLRIGKFVSSGFSVTWRRSDIARRREDWNVGLAHDLQDPKFSRVSARRGRGWRPCSGVARQVIRAMGVKEFSAKVRTASPNVLRAINPRHNPTQDALNRVLRPFKLRLTLAPIEPSETASRRDWRRDVQRCRQG